jgi:epoxide hydrolase-like predicted phosphatase
VATIDTVIFDLGGVLSLSGRAIDVARRFPSHPPEVVMNVLMGDYASDHDHPWHRLERGEISMNEYREAVAPLIAEAGLVAAEPPPEFKNRTGVNFAFVRSEPMFALVDDLRAGGLRVGVLTNNVRELRSRWWDLVDFPSLFDDIVDSHEVGLRKPNAEIYHLALDRLGAAAERTAFLDDMLVNVNAARAVGMHGVLVEDDQSGAIATVRDLAGV